MSPSVRGDIIRLTMPLAAGMKLDGYEVLGLLGAGGMGEVYRACDPALKRDVAIKVLPTFVSQDPDRLHRFEQEAQAAAARNHPNILAVYRWASLRAHRIWYPSFWKAIAAAAHCDAARCRFAKRSITAFRSRMD